MDATVSSRMPSTTTFMTSSVLTAYSRAARRGRPVRFPTCWTPSREEEGFLAALHLLPSTFSSCGRPIERQVDGGAAIAQVCGERRRCDRPDRYSAPDDFFGFEQTKLCLR